MPVSYKDIAKAVSDLLDRGFETANSIKVNTKAANGVSYNAEVAANSKDPNQVTAKVGFKLKHSSGVNFKKFEISNDGKLATDVRLEDAIKNATLTLGLVLPALELTTQSEKFEVGVEVDHDKAFLVASVSPVDVAASASVVFKATDTFSVGASYAGHMDDTWKTNAVDVAAAYADGAGTSIAIASKKVFKEFSITAHRQHSADIALATRLGLNRDRPTEASLEVAGSYKIDADTTASGKVSVPTRDVAGSTATLGLKHKLSSAVRVTAGTVVQLNPAHDHQFGAKYALGVEFGTIA
jgi:hypothetical protein